MSDWERIAGALARALESFTAYDGSGQGGPEDGNSGNWRAAENALDDFYGATHTSENVECPDDEILDELAVNFYLYADRQFKRNTSSKTRAWVDARNARRENVECPACAGDGRVWCGCDACQARNDDRCSHCTPENVESHCSICGEVHRYGEVNDPCDQCHGAGWLNAGGWSPRRCAACGGTGHMPENVECPTCGGDRWVDNRCPCCNTNLGPKRCPDCTPENVESPTGGDP